MEWFKLQIGLAGHPKRFLFEELAGTEYGMHYLTLWFTLVCSQAPSGDVSRFTPGFVARACEWKGEPKRLWDALVGSGFIDVTEDGAHAHDWYEQNARFIKENSKRKEPKGFPRVSQGLPVRQDKTGQDKTGQDQPPLVAAVAAESPRVAPKKVKAQHPGFIEFYAAYPRHDARADAEKAWSQVKPDLQEVLAAVKWQAKSADHLGKDEKRFIPLPASWLRAKRWLDEPPQSVRREMDRQVSAAPAQCEHLSLDSTEHFTATSLTIKSKCRKCGKQMADEVILKSDAEKLDLAYSRELVARWPKI